MKQGDENTKFVKDDENPTKKYLFQKNNKTKIAFYFIAVVLILLILAIVITGNYFGN